MEDVGKEPSLDSLDLGFPDDEEESQSGALFKINLYFYP